MSQQVYSNQEKKYPLRLTDGSLRLITDQELKTTSNVTFASVNGVPLSGNIVTNPGLSTDNAIARFDGVTGKIIQTSTATLSDTGDMAVGSLTLSGVTIQPANPTSVYTVTLPDAQSAGVLTNDGIGTLSWSPNGTGDVDGPVSSTGDAVVRFDGTTGKLIQDSTVTIDDAGVLTVPSQIKFGVNGNLYSDTTASWQLRDNSDVISTTSLAMGSTYTNTLFSQSSGTAAATLGNNSLTTGTIAGTSTLTLTSTTANDINLSPGGNGGVTVNKNNNTSAALSVKQNVLANPSLIVTPDAAFEIGPGTTPFDTVLRREGVAFMGVRNSTLSAFGTFQADRSRVNWIASPNGTDMIHVNNGGSFDTAGGVQWNLYSAGGFFTGLKSVATAHYTISFPTTQGTAGSTLRNDGTGQLSWLDMTLHNETTTAPSGAYSGGGSFSWTRTSHNTVAITWDGIVFTASANGAVRQTFNASTLFSGFTGIKFGESNNHFKFDNATVPTTGLLGNMVVTYSAPNILFEFSAKPGETQFTNLVDYAIYPGTIQLVLA